MKHKETKRVTAANALLKHNYWQDQTTNELTSARENARERFVQLGCPLPNDEYWKFSSPQRFTSPDLVGEKDALSFQLPKDRAKDEIRLTFVDGILNKDASDLTDLPSSLEIVCMRDEIGIKKDWIKGLYGTLEAKSHKQIQRPLAAFNTACASDGVFIRVKKKISRKIIIYYISTKPNFDSIVHNLVKVEKDSEVTLIEKGEGSRRSSRVTEVDLLASGTLNHIRFFGNDPTTDFHSQVFVRQAIKSTYNEFSLVINNEYIRNEFYVSLEGEKAKVSLSGANLARQTNVQDDTIFVAHLSPECESRQVFKKVLSDEASGIFQGKIFVTSDAQKTDGYQISKGLLLGNETKFLTKPELEIYADDVVCSHGSTCGAIDEEILFYLTSRGVQKKEAIGMLILAFLDESIQEIESDELASEIRDTLLTRSEIDRVE